MPEVIDKILFERGKEIPPGGVLESSPFDVKGAQHLTVNMQLGGSVEHVRCDIAFGHMQAGFLTFQTDTFGPARQLWRRIAVHGPTLVVSLTNDGTQPADIVDAWIYGVREVP